MRLGEESCKILNWIGPGNKLQNALDVIEGTNNNIKNVQMVNMS